MLQPHQAVLLHQAIEIDHHIAAHIQPLSGNGMVDHSIEIDLWIPIPFCPIVVIIAEQHAVVLKALSAL